MSVSVHFSFHFELAFAHILLSKTSVDAFPPFNNTDSQFSEYGKRQNYARKRLRHLAAGLFQLNGCLEGTRAL